MTVSVGIIGARGYVGRELLRLLAGHPEVEVVYASSREWAGQALGKVYTEFAATPISDLVCEALGPEEMAARPVDVAFLGLPNGKAAPFVAAIEETSPQTCLIDLSADYRADPAWAYGLPELGRTAIVGAKRIANPGCYATAAQLAIAPLASLWQGPVTVTGLSGWSGAGTTPSRKNDPEALRDNAIPYGLVDHGHEAEIAHGAKTAVHFTPVVMPFFRGLVALVSGRIVGHADPGKLIEEAYEKEPFIRLIAAPAEPAAVAGSLRADLSLPVCAAEGDRIVLSCALDNLLKGAASQAVQNLNVSLGLPEGLGLSVPPPSG
ncbi:N-acetyl-gamma-glutamyl-phosphate reductase [Parvularcula bermudensis HTCC2503]|uniref:N-acetyl-gamma-glutamyl-phosphate reductase n=1 Tax=Parvularcula bermudensis (strain ATCC BAA-594 / HTCC2503 / KCTC 12087) TaxID=314260 RepID=E0THW5_PARBH|nr:N-acetyl-gamma-glutamyl-phosphate reductase [Parvularcula bermudensis]ADM10258.1 N-acetyl-gamma-glutamyl-phosphate reductase [Parvularcula bermudensis HTCC2503]